ncbi:MAG TPA: DUF5668 domain-containing protein [Roseiflexaceae bacterium]|nr:DUF5668 domain-containing protein [Roseiflexaceae bacterium]
MNATSTVPERPARRDGLVVPAMMIGLGVVLLLNSLGLLSWDVWWTLSRLWPLLLIAAGLELIIGRRSALASLLLAAILLGGLALAVRFSGAWLGAGTPIAGETISQPLGTANRAEVAISMGAGTLRLGALEDSEQLLAGTIDRWPGEQVVRDAAVKDGVATLKLHSQTTRLFPFERSPLGEHVWDLRLNSDVPLSLRIDSGAGVTTLDLARLRLTSLTVNAGVGQAMVTLPRQGRLEARVNGGIGQTTITIPAGVAARIEAHTGIGQVHVNGNFQRQDRYYISPGFDTAEQQIRLEVDGGIGGITIQQELGR